MMKRRKLLCITLLTLIAVIFFAFPALAAEESSFADSVAKVNDSVNSFVWTAMLFAILGVGLIMTVITGGFQFTHFRYWWQHSIGSVFKRKDVLHSDDKKSISQFQSLCTAMAATVGTGNIVGVATAIVSGGPGAIFWMWIAAILGLMTNFSENVLGIFYRRRNANAELTVAINRFLATLDGEERKVFLRRYWYFASIKEIAARYGFTKSKVKMMLKRTRDRLADYLKREELLQ